MYYGVGWEKGPPSFFVYCYALFGFKAKSISVKTLSGRNFLMLNNIDETALCYLTLRKGANKVRRPSCHFSFVLQINVAPNFHFVPSLLQPRSHRQQWVYV